MTDFTTGTIAGASTRRSVLKRGAVAGIATLGLSGSVAGDDDHDSETAEPSESEDGSEPEPFASVEFTNQFFDGTNVVVDATILSDGGWITFHDVSLFEGRPLESVVGISNYLAPGIHYQVPVTLLDVPGREFEMDAFSGTTPLIAMPHRDTNDNQEYEFVTSEAEEDIQYTAAGYPIVDLGQATVGEANDEGGDAFASVDLENQQWSDAVIVDEAVLSEGGFVTLHDIRLLRGAPFESVVGVSEYLTPGEHEDIEVPITDPGNITSVEFPPAPPLIAMPHRDTNGNREYDFVSSEGGADGPYVAADSAIVDLAFVEQAD